MLHAAKQHIQQIPGEEKMALKTEEVHTTNVYFMNTLKKGSVNLEGLSIKTKLTALPTCKEQRISKNVDVTVTKISLILLPKLFPNI